MNDIKRLAYVEVNRRVDEVKERVRPAPDFGAPYFHGGANTPHNFGKRKFFDAFKCRCAGNDEFAGASA